MPRIKALNSCYWKNIQMNKVHTNSINNNKKNNVSFTCVHFKINLQSLLRSRNQNHRSRIKRPNRNRIRILALGSGSGASSLLRTQSEQDPYPCPRLRFRCQFTAAYTGRVARKMSFFVKITKNTCEFEGKNQGNNFVFKNTLKGVSHDR